MDSLEIGSRSDVWDSGSFRWTLRPRVRISAGQLQGLEGRSVHRLEEGRVLVELRRGLLVELEATCLEWIG